MDSSCQYAPRERVLGQGNGSLGVDKLGLQEDCIRISTETMGTIGTMGEKLRAGLHQMVWSENKTLHEEKES